MTTVAGAVPVAGIVFVASPVMATPLGMAEIIVAVGFSLEGVIVNTPGCPDEKDEYAVPGTSTIMVPGFVPLGSAIVISWFVVASAPPVYAWMILSYGSSLFGGIVMTG